VTCGYGPSHRSLTPSLAAQIVQVRRAFRCCRSTVLFVLEDGGAGPQLHARLLRPALLTCATPRRPPCLLPPTATVPSSAAPCPPAPAAAPASTAPLRQIARPSTRHTLVAARQRAPQDGGAAPADGAGARVATPAVPVLAPCVARADGSGGGTRPVEGSGEGRRARAAAVAASPYEYSLLNLSNEYGEIGYE